MSKFVVSVENAPVVRFDDLDAALRHARSKVYLADERVPDAEHALQNGLIFEWNYGFAGVTIYPTPGQESAS